jgi:DNA-binding MarR family transcriptional regulator
MEYTPPLTISGEEFLKDGSDATFRKAVYAWTQSASRLLAFRDVFGRELDVTPSQFAVLMGVAYCQGAEGVTVRDLAEHVALASTHVTTEVGRLSDRGLLAKRPCDTDRRSVRISLTPLGESEIARVEPFVRIINDMLFQGIGFPELEVLQSVARRLMLNAERAMAEVRRRKLERAG